MKYNRKKLAVRRYWNRIRTLASMLAIKAFRKPPYPFYVNLVINSRCNLKCAYCFGRYSSRKTPDWDYQDLTKLIDQLYEFGTRYVLIQGGEPLLHKDLGRIFRYIDDKGIVTALVTNGQFPDRVRNIPEIALLDNICFSLDGCREGNDRVRGDGSYDKVVESIRVVQEVHQTPVRINSTITKYTVGDVDAFAEFVRENNVEWGINFLFKGDEKLGEEDLAPEDEEVIEYQKKFLDYIKRGYPIFTTSKIVHYSLDWPVSYARKFLGKEESLKLMGKRAIECQYGIYEIVIDEDGRVYPCQGMQGLFDAKNLKEVGFKEAFEHLSTKPCYTCYLTSMINTSAMINWDLGVIGETIRGTVRSRIWKNRLAKRM